MLILAAFVVLQACARAPGPPVPKTVPGFGQQSQPLRGLGVPDPVESIDTAAAKIGRASSDKSCKTLDPLIHSYLRPQDSSARRVECLSFLARLEGLGALSAAAYGTGGVIDGEANARDGRSPVTLLLALDTDLHFRLFAIGPGGPDGTIGSAQPDPLAFDSAAAATIDAIRRGDCADLFLLSHPVLAPGASDEATFCAQYQNAGFQIALGAKPEVMPVRLGGNALYGFYGLALGPGRYYTLLLGQHDGRPLFGSEIRAQIS